MSGSPVTEPLPVTWMLLLSGDGTSGDIICGSHAVSVAMSRTLSPKHKNLNIFTIKLL